MTWVLGMFTQMEWTQKVRRLILEKGTTIAKMERAAEWSTNTLADALSKKRDIRISHALSLSRALGVDAGWLYDDDAQWDDRPTEAPLEPAIAELAKRYSRELIHLAAMDAGLRAAVHELLFVTFLTQCKMEKAPIVDRERFEQGWKSVTRLVTLCTQGLNAIRGGGEFGHPKPETPEPTTATPPEPVSERKPRARRR